MDWTGIAFLKIQCAPTEGLEGFFDDMDNSVYKVPKSLKISNVSATYMQ